MKYRLANGAEYRRMVSTCAWLDAENQRDNTSLHWGKYSKHYLNVSVGEHFVLLAESASPYEGWAWVVKYPQLKVYGWVPISSLETVNEVVFLEGCIIAEVRVQPHEADDVCSVNASICPYNLNRVCPDGTDLTKYSNLAVCISDGSSDEQLGIAAASVCIFPEDIHEWEDPATAVKMYARGSATAELVGIALSFNSLMNQRLQFDTAVVYTDNSHCIRYIGD